MHTSYGDMDVAIPRDRNGEYEPQLIKKYQNTVTQDMEEKILSMSSSSSSSKAPSRRTDIMSRMILFTSVPSLMLISL